MLVDILAVPFSVERERKIKKDKAQIRQDKAQSILSSLDVENRRTG